MADRPFLYSVDCGPDPEPPSVLFQRLSADYPDLPRRVVGEVLSRLYGTAWDSLPGPLGIEELERAARTLLDAMRLRAERALLRTGRAVPLRAVAPHCQDRNDRQAGEEPSAR